MAERSEEGAALRLVGRSGLEGRGVPVADGRIGGGLYVLEPDDGLRATMREAAL